MRQEYAELTLPYTSPPPQPERRAKRLWNAIVEDYLKLPAELLDDLHLDVEKVKAGRLNGRQEKKVRRFVVAYLLSRGKSPYEIHLRLGLPKAEISAIAKTLRKDPVATTNREKQKTLMLFRIKEREDVLRRHRTALERKGDRILLADRKVINEIIKTEMDQLEGTRRKLLGLDAPVQHEVKQKRVASIRLVVHGSREQLEHMLEQSGVIDVPSLPSPAEDQPDDCFPEIE
jgi:hypothetical protein